MESSSNRGRALQAQDLYRSGRVWIVVVTALVALATAFTARAQSAGDPPSRAARLSEVSGQVWLYGQDSDEWITVERNRPLTTGDRIATDNGARAEVTLGTTTLRLDGATELEIARLDDSHYSVRLHGGSVAVRLRSPQSLAEFEMNTDEGRFRVQTVGRYRFDRFEQTSDVTVFSGQATYEARNSALPVTTGQHAQFWIDSSGVPQYAMVAPLRDAFASWTEERDRAEDRPVVATRYVSPEMTGADDLDRYGQWQQTPEYGALWVPSSVPEDWAPYSRGHWAWVRPWGWTWVDEAPWGFAPFHYGRWVYHRNAWCWAPGTYVARPVYAPALVAWIGGPRANLSISVGGGAPVGWFPLAPHEVYVPAYRSSPRYVQQINITHVTNVTNITTIVNNRNGEADRREFANRKFAHAVTFVPADVMVRREPVGPAAARFRNDPQVRALASDARPAAIVTAPPVNAPVIARPAPGRPAPRPPFEGRTPGAFAGRPDAVRPDAGGRPDARRGDPARPDAARIEAGRPDAARPDAARPDAGRFDGRPADAVRGDGRPASGRPGERTVTPAIGAAPRPITPTIVAPAAPAPVAPTPPLIGGAPAPATPAGPPAGARGTVDPAAAGSGFRGGPRFEREPGSPAATQRVIPPSPVQRSMPPGEANGRAEAIGRPGETSARPGGAGREFRDVAPGAERVRPANPPPYGAAAGRETPAGQIPQGQIPQGQIPQGQMSERAMPPRSSPPRGLDPGRVAEPVRPQPGSRPAEAVVVPRPAAVAPAPAPAAVAPPVVVVPPAARPAEAQRPAGEGRMNRPEAPRGEERPEQKAERQR